MRGGRAINAGREMTLQGALQRGRYRGHPLPRQAAGTAVQACKQDVKTEGSVGGCRKREAKRIRSRLEA